MQYGQPPPPRPPGAPGPIYQEFNYLIPLAADKEYVGHRTTLYPVRSGMVNMPFRSRSEKWFWHSCLTLVTTNAKSLWIRGEHAQATEEFLHRHGWDRTNTEDLDLPGDCAHHLNQIHSGAAQWNSMRTTLITGSGTFSGVGCAGSKELRWKLCRLALAITLNENLGAAPVNLFWKDLHDAHENRDDAERERSIEREIVSKEGGKTDQSSSTCGRSGSSVSDGNASTKIPNRKGL
jgi:hypothetical protein